MRYIKTLKKRLQPERYERLSFMEWVRINHRIEKYMIGIFNEGKRHPAVARIYKLMGLVPGVPDYFFLYPTSKYHGLWIEFKYGKNKQDKNQKQFFETASEVNYKCVVVYSAKEAIDAIKEYLQT